MENGPRTLYVMDPEDRLRGVELVDLNAKVAKHSGHSL